MRLLTVGYGTALTALGVGGFIASKRASRTALIPALVGVPVMALGAASFLPLMRKPALRASAALATAALTGASRGLGQVPALFQGRAERPMAVAAQGVMAALSLGYLVASRAANK